MYEFFTDDFGGLPAEIWNWIATGICILFALLLIVAILRWLRGPRLGNRRGRNARLAVTDATAIGDERRKLVLVRRDNVEHLLLIGGPTDLVIETNIDKTQAANSASDTMAKPPAKQFSKAAKEAPRKDPSLLAPEPAPVVEESPAPTVAPLKPVASEPVAPKPVAPKPAVNPEPVPQPAVAVSPAVAPQVSTPTPSAQPAITPSSIPAATAVITAPIVAALAGETAPEPEAVTGSVSTPSVGTETTALENSEDKLGPVEEMDALLKEISADK